jgi:thioredoxin-related protein
MAPAVLSLVVLALAGGVGCSRTPPPDLGYFTSDIKGSVVAAKAGNKLVMVDLYADWCRWCKKLDTDVFDNANVREILTNHFLSVKVDIEASRENAELAQKFGTTGLPHIVFLNGEGEKVHEISGYLPANEFADELKALVKKTNGGTR